MVRTAIIVCTGLLVGSMGAYADEQPLTQSFTLTLTTPQAHALVEIMQKVPCGEDATGWIRCQNAVGLLMEMRKQFGAQADKPPVMAVPEQK